MSSTATFVYVVFFGLRTAAIFASRSSGTSAIAVWPCCTFDGSGFSPVSHSNTVLLPVPAYPTRPIFMANSTATTSVGCTRAPGDSLRKREQGAFAPCSPKSSCRIASIQRSDAARRRSPSARPSGCPCIVTPPAPETRAFSSTVAHTRRLPAPDTCTSREGRPQARGVDARRRPDSLNCDLRRGAGRRSPCPRRSVVDVQRLVGHVAKRHGARRRRASPSARRRPSFSTVACPHRTR